MANVGGIIAIVTASALALGILALERKKVRAFLDPTYYRKERTELRERQTQRNIIKSLHRQESEGELIEDAFRLSSDSPKTHRNSRESIVGKGKRKTRRRRHHK